MNRGIFLPAEKFLIKADVTLGALIKRQTIVIPPQHNRYFESLSRFIIGQQLSVTAAQSIYDRLLKKSNIDPQQILSLTPKERINIGLSRQKFSYLQNIARYFIDQPSAVAKIDLLPDEVVLNQLTKIKGIGAWTGQMFLMFTLARADIFSPSDVGLRRAMIKLYSLSSSASEADLLEIASRWQPYRSVASLHLWATGGQDASLIKI